MKKWCKKVIILLCVLLASVNLFAANFKENDVVYVKSDNLIVKAKPGVYAKTVSFVDYGTEVVVASQKDIWVQIKVDGVTAGWVPEVNLSKRKVAQIKTSVDIKEISLAGRGVNSGIEKAFSEAYDEHYSDVDKVESFTAKERDVLLFIKEGKLNGGEQ